MEDRVSATFDEPLRLLLGANHKIARKADTSCQTPEFARRTVGRQVAAGPNCGWPAPTGFRHATGPVISSHRSALLDEPSPTSSSRMSTVADRTTRMVPPTFPANGAPTCPASTIGVATWV
jgi:hypothetical protein